MTKFGFFKKILLLGAALALSFSSFAVDFGGALRNTTSFKGNSFSSLKLDQTDDLNLWLKIPFTKSGNVYLTAEALYEFEYDQSAEKVYNKLDLDLFKLSASLKAGSCAISINAGRFMFADLSGIAFRQNADGAYFGFDTNYFSASIYGAYTGLLNANLVTILDNPADPHSADKDLPYDLAQKYVVGAATISLPRLAKTQNLSAQFLGTFKVDGKSYNRMYATLSLSGPIYKTFFYNLASTLGMYSFDGGSIDISNLSQLKFSLFLPFKDLSFNLGGLYASGSQGPFEGFRGFTKATAYNAFSEPQHTGIVKGSFSASIKPVNILLLSAGCDLILNAATSSIDYKGFQYNFGADVQILSDIRAGLSFLQYLDKNNSNEDKVQISLNASITF